MNNYGEFLRDHIDQTFAEAKAKEEDGLRTHLGASVVGDSCMRKVWYNFHWVATEPFSGRMLRLFEHGQREEDVFAAHFRRIGVSVYQHDSKGKQFRISHFGGHYGGSSDGVLKYLPELDDKPTLAEMKTHSDKWFKKLIADGVEATKPKHVRQAQIYMHGLGLKRALYCAINKNDEALHFELLDFNPSVGESMLARARSIIFSKGLPLPPRITNNSAWYECKFCEMREVCWKFSKHQTALLNCRTCQFSTPQVDGTWTCEQGHPEIKTQPKMGCQHHVYKEVLQ